MSTYKAYPDSDEASSAGRDRWLLSYADLLTLLLAFFVVMYSVSAINDDKLAQLSESLAESFNQPASGPDVDVGIDPGVVLEQIGFDAAIDKVGSVDRVEVSLPGELLFESAAAELKAGAALELDRLLPLLRQSVGMIEVIGYTDSVPVSGGRYASNWELSAARAAAAVQYLEAAQIPTERLMVIGRGDAEPVATNATEAGRAANRRVVFKMVIENWQTLQPSAQSRGGQDPVPGTGAIDREGAALPDAVTNALADDLPAAFPDTRAEDFPESISETLPERLPDIDDIDPALLEQLLREIESSEGN